MIVDAGTFLSLFACHLPLFMETTRNKELIQGFGNRMLLVLTLPFYLIYSILVMLIVMLVIIVQPQEEIEKASSPPSHPWWKL